MNRQSGLGLRFLRLLALSALCAIVLFGAVRGCGNLAVDSLVNNANYRAVRAQKRVDSLQSYIQRNQVSATNSGVLTKWCQQQPLIFLEVYRNGKLVFSSEYIDEDTLSEKDVDANFYDWYTYHRLAFADGEAEVLLLCDEVYQRRVWVHIAATLLGVALFFAHLP